MKKKIKITRFKQLQYILLYYTLADVHLSDSDVGQLLPVEAGIPSRLNGN